MAERSPDTGPERYRVGYLKLKRALHDPPSGLPTLPVVLDRVRGWLEQRRTVGLLHLELVNLDLVASIYGWQVVDRVVAAAAGALRDAVGLDLPAEALLVVEHVASERFVVFVPAGPAGAETRAAALATIGRQLAARVEAALAEPGLDGLGPRLHVRTGQASVTLDPFHRFERVVHLALAEARRWDEGRERRRELSWGEELRRIIRDGALDIVLQPVVDLARREVLGHEALVRGPRDTLFEAPRAMFAVSHRVGAAVELDQACSEAALAAFAEAGRSGRLFLNALPESLLDPDWRDARLPGLCASLGLAPREIVLELSERGLGDTPERWIESWSSLRALGFAIAVDDIGTGSITREALEQLRPEFLKLDAAHVREIERNLLRQELLASLVASAAAVGGEVVVEGIEHEAEARVAAELGARYGQGYLFGAPSAAKSLTGRARARGR